MSAEIPAILNFKAKLRTSGNSTIVGKASLNEPSKFSVNNLTKSVKVNCK
jgi:hypothetical protein